METIYELGEECIKVAQTRKKYEAAKTYHTVLRHLKESSGNEHLCFGDLTPEILFDLQRYLLDKKNPCCRNTCMLYFRTLQTLHKKAAQKGMAPEPGTLYADILKPCDPSPKRSLEANMLRRIRDAVLPAGDVSLCFARDLFLLAFYLRGIPYVDMAHLRHTDIKSGVLYYRRSKTGKSLSVTLTTAAWKIINRYKTNSQQSVYLLPIIRKPGIDENEERQYDSARRLYNLHLRKLAKVCGLPEEVKLTSYVSRHTWANIAYTEGVEVSFISEALSHSDERTTRHYLSAFTPDTLAKINQRVIDVLDREESREREKRIKQLKINKLNSSCSLVEPELYPTAK